MQVNIYEYDVRFTTRSIEDAEAWAEMLTDIDLGFESTVHGNDVCMTRSVNWVVDCKSVENIIFEVEDAADKLIEKLNADVECTGMKVRTTIVDSSKELTH